MSKVEYTPKQVIENKLLAALEEPGQVAIIVNAEELQLFITAIALLPGRKSAKCKAFIADLEKLMQAAFPDQAMPPIKFTK